MRWYSSHSACTKSFEQVQKNEIEGLIKSIWRLRKSSLQRWSLLQYMMNFLCVLCLLWDKELCRFFFLPMLSSVYKIVRFHHTMRFHVVVIWFCCSLVFNHNPLAFLNQYPITVPQGKNLQFIKACLREECEFYLNNVHVKVHWII